MSAWDRPRSTGQLHDQPDVLLYVTSDYGWRGSDLWTDPRFADLLVLDPVQRPRVGSGDFVGHITFMTDAQAGAVRFIIVGIALMLLMVFRPQGILGDRKEIAAR